MSERPFEFRIEPKPAERVLEFATWYWPSNALPREAWPLDQGAVRRGALQQPLLLHYAPGRWLAPAPGPDEQAMLEAAVTAGAGALIDATGKWSAFELSGPGAASLLAFTLDVASVLAARECAAVTLFDCPAIVVRSASGYRVWVQSSYAAHFLDTAGQCGAALRRER